MSLNPRPPSELPPGLPAPIRRSCRRRGGPCVARPSYHSAGARDREDRITWRCATIRLVSSLLRAASPTILLRGGASEQESRERGIGNLLGDFGSPWTVSTEFGFGVVRGFITPIKNLPSRWERKRKRKAGARGGEGCKSRREGERQLPRQRTQMNS